MNKKVYATPAMDVVELEVNDIVCASPDYEVKKMGTGEFQYFGAGDGSEQNGGEARGRGRGNSIWDE